MKSASAPSNAAVIKRDFVTQQLLLQIEQGTYQLGEKLPTERNLATLFSVSRVTIRSVLDDLQRKGIISREHGRGTFVKKRPSVAANAYHGGIGLLFVWGQGPNDPYNPRLTTRSLAVSAELNQPIQPIYLSEGQGATDAIEKIIALRPNIRAFVVCNFFLTDEDLERLQGRGLSLVNLSKPQTRFPASFVDINNNGNARMAVDHLCLRGRKKIALLYGLADTSYGKERLEGYCDAMHGHGLKYDPRLIVPVRPWCVEDGYKAMEKFVAEGICPDGVFATGDIAVGVWQYCMEHGIRIPEDLAIVGMGIYAWTENNIPVTLTQVNQPLELMIERAMHLAIEQVDAPEGVYLSETLSSTLDIGQTT